MAKKKNMKKKKQGRRTTTRPKVRFVVPALSFKEKYTLYARPDEEGNIVGSAEPYYFESGMDALDACIAMSKTMPTSIFKVEGINLKPFLVRGWYDSRPAFHSNLPDWGTD